MRSLRWIAVLAAALIPAQGFSADLTLDNITLADFDKIVKEFSGNFAYSTVTPASSLGGLWGFEFGVVGGMTKAPELKALVQRSSASYDEDSLYHGGALLRIGAPLGLTGEALIIPETKVSDLKVSQYAGSVMWTITDVFMEDLPVTVATKGFYSKTSASYSQRVTRGTPGGVAVNANIDFDNTIFGGQLLVSKKVLVFEPYVGIGYAKAKGDLSVNAATAPNAYIFASGERSASSKPSSVQLMAGLDIRLFFLTLGAEYQRSFGTSSTTGRVSFRF